MIYVTTARLAGLAVLALMAVGCSVHSGSGYGRVLDAVSKQPVAGAQVRANCFVASSWHGVKSIEHTATSNTPDGAYFVDPANFHHCADIHVFATRPGYVPNDPPISGIVNEGKGIPEIIYVMSLNDVPRLHLDVLWREASAVPLEAGPNAEKNFASVHRAFRESKLISNSPDHAAWVRDRYCTPLRLRFALLSAVQRAAADDYRTEVLPYCAN